jgi:hypothetical protein
VGRLDDAIATDLAFAMLPLFGLIGRGADDEDAIEDLQEQFDAIVWH